MTQTTVRAGLAAAVFVIACHGLPAQDQAAPVIVVDTSRGTFAFETYPIEAPKTVAHIVDLVKRGFFDGQRFHRVVPGFVVQWGDPQSRDLAKDALWGRGPRAASGSAVGAAEISPRRTHVKGAVALSHPGNPALADSQMYVTLEDRVELDGKYAVFGQVISGLEVLERIQRGDVVTRMYVKD
jgi:cyclophilin family peptidyl-prolyl cis-trans isomerase